MISTSVLSATRRLPLAAKPLLVLGSLGLLALLAVWSIPSVAAAAPAVGQNDTTISSSPETTCANAFSPDNCEARQTLESVLNLMAILVMPLVSIMIIIGGIQYAAAGDNSDAINAARARIYKAILALVFFIILWSFLKWLIPGRLGVDGC